MIRPEHHDNALRSLHAIFVSLRAMAYEKAPHEAFRKACDIAEELPTLFYQAEDMTEYFRQALKELVPIHQSFGIALEYFDRHIR